MTDTQNEKEINRRDFVADAGKLALGAVVMPHLISSAWRPAPRGQDAVAAKTNRGRRSTGITLDAVGLAVLPDVGSGNRVWGGSITIGSLTNGILVVQINSYNGAGAVTGVRLDSSNGISLTQLGAQYSVWPTDNAQWFYLLNPPSGTHGIFVESGYSDGGAILSSWNGVNQANPFGNRVDGYSNPATVTAFGGGVVLDFFGATYNESTPTSDATQTSLGVDVGVSAGASAKVNGSYKATEASGATTMTWANPTGAYSAVALQPEGSTPGGDTEPGPLANVIFNGSDTDPALASMTAAQTYDYWSRVGFTPVPGAYTSPGTQPADMLLTEGTQKILSCVYPAQDAGNYPVAGGGWDVFPTPGVAGSKRHVIKFRWRINWATYNQATDVFAIKFIELNHASTPGRLQTNMHNPVPPGLNPAFPNHGTYMQFYDANGAIGTTDSPGTGTNQPTSDEQGTQPVGPFIGDLINQGWVTYTLDYKQHTSTTVLDGWVTVWLNGTKVIDVRQTNINVTPPGGERIWCSANDVNLIQVNDGTAASYGLQFGGARSTFGGDATFDIHAGSFSWTTD
jgi:hypothetical protein